MSLPLSPKLYLTDQSLIIIIKEYQLESARDELQKLSICESESKRKDEVISALRKEIAEYKKCTQSRDIR